MCLSKPVSDDIICKEKKTLLKTMIQTYSAVSGFIMLYLGSTGMDCVLDKRLETQHDHVIAKSVGCVIKDCKIKANKIFSVLTSRCKNKTYMSQ